MRALLVPLLLLAAVAHAKAWNGIEPGVSRRDEVVKRLGQPSKTLTVSGKEVLAYTDSSAPKPAPGPASAPAPAPSPPAH